MKISPDILPHIPFMALVAGEVFKLVQPGTEGFDYDAIFMKVEDGSDRHLFNAVELTTGILYDIAPYTSIYGVNAILNSDD